MAKTLAAALCITATLTAWGAENDQASIAKGEYLSRAGDCVACHTAKGGKPFAGGLPMETPIGTIFSTNITPDSNSGIGNYSFEDFDNAVRRGIRKDGSTLYPAMPYPSYARVSGDDMRALYAYFNSGVPPVDQINKDSEIPWPMSMRWPLAGWRLMFAPEPNPEAKASGERGAYLVEGLGHCGACHTPRALTLQEKALNDHVGNDFLSGGAPIEGWVPKDLRGSKTTGLGQWTEVDIVQFLKTGRNDRTAVFGGMSEVVDHSLQHLSQDDLGAIARYLKTLSSRNPEIAVRGDDDAAQRLHRLKIESLGARIYADNCMACHRSDGLGYSQTFPGLANNSVLSDSLADSVIRIVLTGYTTPATKEAVTQYTMPAFGWRLSDEEVAQVTTFIRQSWGNVGHQVTADDVAKIRKGISDQELLGAAGPLLESDSNRKPVDK
ncbi:cytochrome c [Pseudomonas sp. PP3]|uniref:c-type cytochrome n=1 Tax=Pseudomonas sp. PP3 TaxID=2815936 RepID=UPI001BB0B938|nr:cytochrome c [Pseudomonas sp. PP3]